MSDLPTGSRLLDHCGTSVEWEPSASLHAEAREHTRAEGLFEAHVVVKAASSLCPAGTWDLHLLPWIYPSGSGDGHRAQAVVFHMKPQSTGRVRLRSRDPEHAPVVERGFLSREEDVAPILEGIDLARTIARTEPLRELLGPELLPGPTEPLSYLRDTVRNYFHPAGTCGIGAVVDGDCRVFGIEGLLVADASVMPTIPRANTNLTTAAIAERVAQRIAERLGD